MDAPIGKKIRYFREVVWTQTHGEGKKLTQVELGELAFGLKGNRAQNKIKKIEAGSQKWMPKDEITKVCKALKITPEQLHKAEGFVPESTTTIPALVSQMYPRLDFYLDGIRYAIEDMDKGMLLYSIEKMHEYLMDSANTLEAEKKK